MDKFFKESCGECALRAQDGEHCALTGRPITTNDYCSNFNKSPLTCDICGSFIIDKPIIDGNTIICWNCLKVLKTCKVCDGMSYCDFETNSSTIPKVVIKEMRQGPYIQRAQVKNPEREKITCHKCKCWHDGTCCKENGYCENHNENLILK